MVVCMLACVAGGGGLLGGMPLWIGMMINEGIYSSMCQGGTSTCVERSSAVEGVFAFAGTVPMFMAPLIGVMLDKKGGRALGTIGSLASAASYLLLCVCMLKAEQGQDFGLLFFPAVMCSMLSGTCVGLCMMAFIWHFASYQATFFAVLSASLPMGAVMPVIMLSLKNHLDVALSTVVFGLVAVSLLNVVVLRLLIPTQEEFYDMARLTLGSAPPPPPGLTPWKAMKAGCQLVGRSKCGWIMVLAMFILVQMEPWMAMAWASPLGETIFGSPADGVKLAAGTLWISMGVGLVAPAFGA